MSYIKTKAFYILSNCCEKTIKDILDERARLKEEKIVEMMGWKRGFWSKPLFHCRMEAEANLIGGDEYGLPWHHETIYRDRLELAQRILKATNRAKTEGVESIYLSLRDAEDINFI